MREKEGKYPWHLRTLILPLPCIMKKVLYLPLDLPSSVANSSHDQKLYIWLSEVAIGDPVGKCYDPSIGFSVQLT